MKKLCFIVLIFLLSIPVLAQEGKSFKTRSDLKQVSFKKLSNYSNIAMIKPGLRITNFSMKDKNNNSLIDPDENISVTFWLSNTGFEKAEDVVFRLSIINLPGDEPENLTTDSLGNLVPNETKAITIAVIGISNLALKTVKFRIEAFDKNGINASPVEVEIGMGERSQPKDTDKGTTNNSIEEMAITDTHLHWMVHHVNNRFIPNR